MIEKSVNERSFIVCNKCMNKHLAFTVSLRRCYKMELWSMSQLTKKKKQIVNQF